MQIKLYDYYNNLIDNFTTELKGYELYKYIIKRPFQAHIRYIEKIGRKIKFLNFIKPYYTKGGLK